MLKGGIYEAYAKVGRTINVD